MLEERPSFLTRLLRGLDGLRRFLVNVLFFGLLAGLVIAGLGGRPKVPDGAALVLNIRGTIVEELAAVDPIERIVARNTGAGAMASETLLKDLVDALRLAKDDARIKAVYLDTNDMAGGGFAKLRVLRAAIADFKKSGKKVIAYGDDYLQSQYYLAAQADEVYLHPEGMVLIYGFGGYYNFYKEGLDRFGIEMHVFRVGEYKSAVEPYLRDDMSKEAREMSLDTLGDLWRGWLADVAEARKITPDAITALVEARPGPPARGGRRRGDAREGRQARRHARAARRGPEAPDRARRRGQGEPQLQAGGLRRVPEGEGRRPQRRQRAGQGRGGRGGQGHDPRRHPARGHGRRRLDGAAAAARPRRRVRARGGAARRQPRRQRLRLGDHPPRVRAGAPGRQAARGLDGLARRLGRLLDRDRVRRDLGGAGDDHGLDRDLRGVPEHPQAAREVLRDPRRRRGHHALHGRACGPTGRSIRQWPTSSSSGSTTATRTSSPAWARRAR